MSSPPVAPAPRRPLILLRASATALAALAVLQTVLAGSYLNGHYESLALHEAAARAVLVAACCQLVAGALVRRPGRDRRGPRGPLWLSVLLVATVTLQTAVGYNRAIGVHVVLGVLLVGGILAGLVGAWRLPLPARTGAAAADPEGAGRLPRPGGPVEVAQ
ncbi:hypothetical protein OG618_28075 [Kitasatospora sp. NBC_01246]|uniref:hypothetical protein n=1 Tax=Kitasatospora sp. NBC_01246 TaxID=2903570 RepID=UPI002E323ED2|nr:hypothetical protein [Kitasatospora sp. NBC_01246]